MNNKSEMQELLKAHIEMSRNISKHFMKIGKKETSTCIKHEVIITDGRGVLKTKITLLPHRRMYFKNSMAGAYTEDTLYEMEEDIQL